MKRMLLALPAAVASRPTSGRIMSCQGAARAASRVTHAPVASLTGHS